MIFNGELAVKFALQTASHYGTADWLRLARLAHDEGFTQVWLNDNLGQRQIFVLLAAIAAQVPIAVGTSVITPYFRNPVDLAGSLATLGELSDGRPVRVGIARGDAAYAGRQIAMPKPLAMVRETVLAVRELLLGRSVAFRDFPTVADYHHIAPQQEFRLASAPRGDVKFFCGGNGPKILKIAGAVVDGALIGNHFIPLVRSGRLPGLLEIARESAVSASALA